ncbi:hypothetical protein GWK47_031452 [Chionoecetes opilio]|uniref:CCHC-type domain-containing protein n=1 Tax=Chionoecetes opilio TaxID=41210 RepID=A0A8J4YKN1_CHIOP|nr:hypothetical protein GWK47_031452 [Chionoecetes opilio]
MQKSSTSTVTTGTEINSPDPIPSPSRSALAITEVSPPQPYKTQLTPPSITATMDVTLTDTHTSPTPTPSATLQPKDAAANTTISDDHQSDPLRTSQPATLRGDQGKLRSDTAYPTSQNTGIASRQKTKNPAHRQSLSLPRTPSHKRRLSNYTAPPSQPVPLLSLPLPAPRGITAKEFCYYCNRSGHTDNTCHWLNWCDHCYREGHNVEKLSLLDCPNEAQKALPSVD